MAAKNVTCKVVRVDDAEFENAYGGCFIAKCSDGWESEKRSSKARAQAEGDTHLASLTADAEE